MKSKDATPRPAQGEEEIVEAMIDAYENWYHAAYLSCGTLMDNKHESMTAALSVARPLIAREARRNALEDARDLASDNGWEMSRNEHINDYEQGAADMADKIADAIEALKERE